MPDQVIEQWRIEDGRSIELLSRDRRAHYGENSRAHHRANAQRGERPRPKTLLEPVLRTLRVGDELVDGLLGEKLAGQS